MWFSSEWLRFWLLQNSRERIMAICRDSVTSMRKEGLWINHVPASSVSGDDILNELE